MSKLYVDRRGVSLNYDSEAIAFSENQERIGTVPIAPLERVILRGDVTIQASVLGHLGAAGVGVLILSGRKGEPTLLLPRFHRDARRRVRQILASENAEFRFQMALHFVAAKALGQRLLLEELLQRRPDARYALSAAIRQMVSALDSLESVKAIDGLRGKEGAVARAHFAGLAAVLPPSLGFSGRNRRPPKDPVNAALSLGYTLVYAEAAQLALECGLDPYVGFLHDLSFGRESLAADLLEPVRPEVDRFVLELFAARTLREEDFSVGEAGCIMGKSARVRFYAAYDEAEHRFRKSLTGHVDMLCESLAQFERGEALDGAQNDALPHELPPLPH